MASRTAPEATLDPAEIEMVLLAAAEAARERTLPLFRTALAVDNKLSVGFDPVTDADRHAEGAIRALIETHFPEHGIIGEELDDKTGSGPFEWIIDPIDGTRAFISGVPVWGTLIGLLHEKRAIAGLMAQPFIGETFLCVDGRAQYRREGESMPLRTSAVTRLAEAKLTATTPELFSQPSTLAGWQAVSSRALQVRYGLDCYGYCLLAAGQIDLVVEAGLKNVDIAPLIPIIEGAGGIITTWQGGPAEAGGTCVAAATPELHREVLELLSDTR